MKNNVLFVCKIASALIIFFLFISSSNAQKYYITFGGSGDTNIVKTVTVENLTQKTSLTLPGDQTLILKLGDVGVKGIQAKAAQQLSIYPNPSNGTSFMQFSLPNDGNVNVSLYDMAGRLHKQSTFFLGQGIHTLTLPAMATGVYLLSVRSADYACFGKWVSMAGEQSAEEKIQYISSAPLTEKETTKTTKSTEDDEYIMDYTANDLLRFTGQNGNYRTIVMKRPVQSQQIDFRFFACEDGCGNHYPIVEIAGNYWMAEDLVCNADSNESALSIMWSSEQWENTSHRLAVIAYRDFGSFDPNYGAYYNYTAALRALPQGFRLPSKEEFEALYTVMGRENIADVALGLLKDGDSTITLWNDVPASDYRNETGFGAKATGYVSASGSFNAKNTGIAYWTSTETGTGDIHTPYITKNNVITTSSSKLSGFKVRGVAGSSSSVQTLKSIFGDLPSKDESAQKPVGTTYVMEDNRKKLFFVGGRSSDNTNYVRRVDDITTANSGSTASVDLSNVPQDSVWAKWKVKKAVSQRNASGRENLVIVVQNVDARNHTNASYGNSEATTTLYIFGDSVNAYAPTTVNLTGSLPVAKVNGLTQEEIGTWDGANGKVAHMNWFFDIKTCDINGDFIEDFIITGRHKIAIYDGSTYSLIAWKDFSADHSSITTTNAFYTRVATGDVNQDGKNDIVVAICAPKSTAAPKIHVFLDGDMQNAANHKIFTLPDSLKGRGINITMGDVTGDGKKEIVINAKHWGTSKASMSIYSLSMDENNNFTALTGLVSNVEVHRRTVVDHINVVYFDGLAEFSYIASGNKVFQNAGSAWQEVQMNGNGNVLMENSTNRVIHTDQVTVSAYFDDSREHLVYLVYGVNDNTPDREIYTYRFGKEDSTFVLHKKLRIYFPSMSTPDELLAPSYYEFPVIATVRSNRAARILSYKRHEYMYSNLQINAVLAAAPYQTDKMEQGSTFWGKSNSSGSQTESEYKTTASAIFGFEQEFSIPLIGIKAGGIDFTTKTSFGYTRGYSKETTVTKSTVHTASGQNAVVVSMIPYHAYFYTILKSDNSAEIGNELMMAFPDNMVEAILPMDEYHAHIKNDGKAPRLNTVFTHTIGVPSSYPQNENNLSNAGDKSFCYNGGTTFALVSPGNTKTEKSIEITQQQANSTAMSVDVDIELVANIGGVKLGAGFGFGSTNKVTKTIGESTKVGGEIISPPTGVQGFNQFSWNIVFYNYKIGNVVFPVVNYLVR